MQFGIFDHVDRAGPDLGRFYEDRLRWVELLDAMGFSRYHVAEHHATPLGMSPSPSVYLSAIAQRTSRLRLGPMVYALPLYHPLRLTEEICMLDQLSGGRLELGFGRGASTIEASYLGRQPQELESIYQEALQVVLGALQRGHFDFAGKHFTFDNVPLCLEPVQRPHPPLWYGVHSTDSAIRAAAQGLNLISLDNAHDTQAYVEAFRNAWRSRADITGKEPPLIGISYFMVLDERESNALAVARRAYAVWHDSFYFLTKRHGSKPRHQRPPEFDGIMAEGRAIAGTPKQVAEFLATAIAVSGIDYVVAQIAFGDQTYDEMARSTRLFAEHVMPTLGRHAFPSREA